MSRQKRQHLKKRPDGRYVCYYHDKAFYGRTEPEALEARDSYKAAEKMGVLVKESGYTVGQYAMAWLPVHKAGVKDNTFNTYLRTLKSCTAPIADILLSDLTTDDIARCYAAMVGKSSSYIARAKTLLAAILDSATDAEYMKRNPCRASSVRAPTGSYTGHRCITLEERRLILTTPHRMQRAALVMLFAGLRRGEMLALTPESVKDGHISVTEAVFFVGRRAQRGEPKTAGSTRRVPVPDILAPWLDVLPPVDVKTEGAFVSAWESYQKALSKAAGHPVAIRCHDLRVTYCTMLRDAGVDIKTAMVWMGHSDEKMILRVYDQPGEEREKQAEKLLNLLLNGQNGGQNAE